MSYYNTTNESYNETKEYREQAVTQDTKIMEIVEGLGTFSPSLVFTEFLRGDRSIPMTSVRRSINTLFKKGLITKTGKKVTGMFGRPELQYDVTKIEK